MTTLPVLAVGAEAIIFGVIVVGSLIYNAVQQMKTTGKKGTGLGSAGRGSASGGPNNLTMEEHQARERAKALYEERAAALRRASMGGGQTEQPRATREAESVPILVQSESNESAALEVARERARQVAKMRRERELRGGSTPSGQAQQPMARPTQGAAPRPMQRPTVATAPRPAPRPASRPVQQKPAPQPSRQPVRQAAPVRRVSAEALSAESGSGRPMVSTDDGSIGLPTDSGPGSAADRETARVGAAGRPVLRVPGMGDRPGVVLTRGSMRQALILREVLDPPLALRKSSLLLWEPA